MALFQFVVFMHGVEVDRAHVIELARQFRDDRFELLRVHFARDFFFGNSRHFDDFRLRFAAAL